MSKKTVVYKLVLLGDAAVGKSSCVERFVKADFFQCREPTIGAAFLTQTVTLDDCIVKYEIWDTAGQERYRSLAPMYYRGAAAALVVYDIQKPDSFDVAKKWVAELQSIGNTDMVIGLAGNKLDLADQRRVPTEEAAQFARDNGCIFYETSAKSGENINAIFNVIAQKLPKTQLPARPEVVTILRDDDSSSSSSCC